MEEIKETNNADDTKPNFFCETCKYVCKYNSSYMKHLLSEKHKRKGEKKVYKCDKCEYKTNTSHWNLKLHITSKHSTIEEKSKHKYYCALCDSIFFSPLFLKNHQRSILHLNNKLTKGVDSNTLDENNLEPNIENVNEHIKRELKEELKAELKVELKNELRKELMTEFKRRITECFA